MFFASPARDDVCNEVTACIQTFRKATFHFCYCLLSRKEVIESTKDTVNDMENNISFPAFLGFCSHCLFFIYDWKDAHIVFPPLQPPPELPFLCSSTVSLLPFSYLTSVQHYYYCPLLYLPIFVCSIVLYERHTILHL